MPVLVYEMPMLFQKRGTNNFFKWLKVMDWSFFSSEDASADY